MLHTHVTNNRSCSKAASSDLRTCRAKHSCLIHRSVHLVPQRTTSVNAVGEAELAPAVGGSHQAKRRRTATRGREDAVLTQQTPLLHAEAAAPPPVPVPTQQVSMHEPKFHAPFLNLLQCSDHRLYVLCMLLVCAARGCP